jgi:hypothetical protein
MNVSIPPELIAYRKAFAARVYEAFDERRAAARRKRQAWGQKEFGDEVARLIPGRDKPYAQGLVSRWMDEESPVVPDVPVQVAIAKVLGVRDYWLILGEEPRRSVALVEEGSDAVASSRHPRTDATPTVELEPATPGAARRQRRVAGKGKTGRANGSSGPTSRHGKSRDLR